MSLNAAMIELLRDKGLNLDDIIEVLWEMEGGRPPPRIPAQPANDRVRRFNSNGRRRIYDGLAERDEETCAQCGCPPRTVWRRQGATVSDDGGAYTIVWPTSNLEIDHRTPLWAGGDNDMDNLWLLCVDCHKVKTASEASQRRSA